MTVTAKQAGLSGGEGRRSDGAPGDVIDNTQAVPPERGDPPLWEALFGALDAALMAGDV